MNRIAIHFKGAITSKRSPISRIVKSGELYKHYKGDEYKIICVSTHTESEESLINYYNILKPEKIWSRPNIMFNEYVEINDADRLRFTLVSQ